MHCLTAWEQWAEQLLQCTASLPGGSGQWTSCYAPPHGLGAVGSGTPAMHCLTAWGRWAVELLQCTAHCLQAVGSACVVLCCVVLCCVVLCCVVLCCVVLCCVVLCCVVLCCVVLCCVVLCCVVLCCVQAPAIHAGVMPNPHRPSLFMFMLSVFPLSWLGHIRHGHGHPSCCHRLMENTQPIPPPPNEGCTGMNSDPCQGEDNFLDQWRVCLPSSVWTRRQALKQGQSGGSVGTLERRWV